MSNTSETKAEFSLDGKARCQVDSEMLMGNEHNAELIRGALVKILPSNSIVLVAHDHFGIDLAPGLSIKLNAAFVSDVTAIDATRDARH